MARFVDYPATDYEPALKGWTFDHRATGEPIGPFADKEAAEQAEREHYATMYAMPAWALYQS